MATQNIQKQPSCSWEANKSFQGSGEEMPTVEQLLLQLTTVTKCLPGKSVPRRLETGLFWRRDWATHSTRALPAKGNRMQVGGGAFSGTPQNAQDQKPTTLLQL